MPTGIHSQTIGKPQLAVSLPSTITNCRPMTQHRFIRSSPSVVLKTAYLGQKPLDDRAFDQIQHWRRVAESERSNAVHWYHHVPGIGDVACCLAVDQGARVLLHISPPRRQLAGGCCRNLWCDWRCRHGLIASWPDWRGSPRRSMFILSRIPTTRPNAPKDRRVQPSLDEFWAPIAG